MGYIDGLIPHKDTGFSYLWKTTEVLSPRVKQPLLPKQKQGKPHKTRKPGLAASLCRKNHMEKLTELRIAWKWTKAKSADKKEKPQTARKLPEVWEKVIPVTQDSGMCSAIEAMLAS